MKYKTFSQWLEMAKPGMTSPTGSAGGSKPSPGTAKTAKEAAAQVAAAIQKGQDPKQAAGNVITRAVQQAGQQGSMEDVADLAKAAEGLKGMKKKMKK